MGAYENPQTVITDTSSAWTNMSKSIANTTVKFLEKQTEVQNEKLKKQQKEDLAYSQRLVKNLNTQQSKLYGLDIEKQTNDLFNQTISDKTTLELNLEKATTPEERSIYATQLGDYNNRLNQILDFAKNKDTFKENFLDKNDPTSRNGEGQWSIQGVEDYSDWINYGQNYVASTTNSFLSFDELGELKINIANPENQEEFKSWGTTDFFSKQPPITPMISEGLNKRLLDRGILNSKTPGKLADEYNTMKRNVMDAMAISDVIEPYAESILTDPDAAQSVWINVLKQPGLLEMATEEEGRFPIEGSPFSKESAEKFIEAFNNFAKNKLPKNHPVAVKAVKDRIETAEEIVEEKFNNYIEELDTSWTDVTGETASFDPKTNMLTVTVEMENEDGDIITEPELYDLSQPGQFTNYIRLLLDKSPDLGNDIKSREIKRSILEKAKVKEKEYLAKSNGADDYKGFEDYLTGQIKKD